MTVSARALLGFVVVAVLVAACAGAGASAAPVASPAPPGSAPPSASPEVGSGDPGPVESRGGVPGSELVEPQPGQQNVVAVPIDQLEAAVDGRTVILTAYWSSGVAPCSVLDQVLIDVGEGTIDVTIREGTSDPEAMCIMILQAKHTVVSFEVDPGTWTIRDSQGQAPPIEVTVS